MIIWRRWGILAFLAFGLGVAPALWVSNAMGLTGGFGVGALVWGFAALFNLMLALWVYPRLDRPQPRMVVQPLAEPLPLPDGSFQTEAVVPALDSEGNPILDQRHSSIFFIPARYLWVVLAAGAVVFEVLALLGK